MIFYLLIFIIVIALYFNSVARGGISKKSFRRVFVFLALFVGLGDMIGGFDRYIYGQLFDEIADITDYGGIYFRSGLFLMYFKEMGYVVYNILLSHITSNRYIFIFITTLIIYLLIYKSFVRYTNNYGFACILFLGFIFILTFTYLRQLLAIAIVWMSIKYIIERKFWKFFLIVLFAASFHNSAILFVVAYFIPIKKFKLSTVVAIMLVCFILGITGTANNVFEIYGGVEGSEQRAMAYMKATGQFKVEYIIEAVFFLVIILSLYKKIPKDTKQIVCLNQALCFCAILILFSKSIFGSRLSWFFMLGLISTITYLVTVDKKIIIQSVLMIIVSLVLFVRILIIWPVFYPYKTFLTPGYTQDIWQVHDTFEYDSNYDENKFYR